MKERLILEFFDFAKPCPKEIPFCEDFRKKYQDELSKLTSGGGCSTCKKNSLKAAYMKEIWEKYLTTTI